MCAGRVPGRSDVPVEFAAGIPIIRLALAFPTRSGGRKPPVEKRLFRRPESHICNSVRTRSQERMACASCGERIESAAGIRMCAGRVPGRSNVLVEFAAGIRIIRPALAFPTWSGWRKPAVGHIHRCESETHIARDVSRMQPRAVGVSPPWRALRTRTRSAEIHRIALADAVRKTTAG